MKEKKRKIIWLKLIDYDGEYYKFCEYLQCDGNSTENIYKVKPNDVIDFIESFINKRKGLHNELQIRIYHDSLEICSNKDGSPLLDGYENFVITVKNLYISYTLQSILYDKCKVYNITNLDTNRIMYILSNILNKKLNENSLEKYV